MKRSELLNKMTEDVWWCIQSLSETRKCDAAVIAKRLLEICEEAGMLPPIEPGRTEYDLDLGVPEWEPEDEE